MSNTIDKQKIVEWIEDCRFKGRLCGELEDLLIYINSGEFDSEEAENLKQFNKSELSLLRQWFNAVHDLNESYLNKTDYALVEKIKKLKDGEFDCEEAKIPYNDDFINSLCMTYRHDFGLMEKEEKEKLKGEAKRWIEAINKELKYLKEEKKEAEKSEWKPGLEKHYFLPCYFHGLWLCKATKNFKTKMDISVIKAGEAFKTEEACKRYMNAKGQYNDKPWEV